MATLSEAESKARLAAHGVAVPEELLAGNAADAATAAGRLGFPVALKACGRAIAHKTERGLVRLGLADGGAVERAATELLAAITAEDGDVELLVAPMVRGNRELIAGVVRDPQFGPCVMLGVGGILAEAVGDVAFRAAPLTAVDAEELIDDLATVKLLGPFRGEPAVDRAALASVLIGLGELATSDESVVAVDLNPLIISDGRPVVVDALVEVAG